MQKHHGIAEYGCVNYFLFNGCQTDVDIWRALIACVMLNVYFLPRVSMTKRIYGILPNLIAPITGLGADIYLPSLPYMAKHFAVTNVDIQLTVTAFVLAMGIAQLLAGPISDALGRKKLIVGSIIIQLLTVILIIIANSIIQVSVARFIQGFASAFMVVPARAILNDCFEGDELKKRFNYLTIFFAVSPIVAPFIGGYCQYYFGWQSSFYLLITYMSIVLFVVLFFSTETIKEKKPFSMVDMKHNYSRLITTKRYIYPVLLITTMYGFTALFNVLGPFIFQIKFGFNPVIYGYIALSIGFAWFAGNVTNRVFFNYSTHKKVAIALKIQSIAIVFLLLCSLTHFISPVTVLISFFCMVFSAAIIFPIFVGECLSMFPNIAASSNSLLFASAWLGFSVYTFIATVIPLHRRKILYQLTIN